jgi:hypothetical protein
MSVRNRHSGFRELMHAGLNTPGRVHGKEHGWEPRCGKKMQELEGADGAMASEVCSPSVSSKKRGMVAELFCQILA